MADQHSERRAQRRIRRQIPITVASCAIEPNSSAVTRDLSTSGIFFHTDSPIRQGSSLEIVLLLPPELTAGEKRWVFSARAEPDLAIDSDELSQDQGPWDERCNPE